MGAAAGLAPDDSAAVAGRVLEVLAVPQSQRAALRADLELDLRRETPRRLRLFRALNRAARARPLVIIPVVHGFEPLGVTVREPWSWQAAGRGRAKAGPAGETPREDVVDALAWKLVEGNFA